MSRLDNESTRLIISGHCVTVVTQFSTCLIKSLQPLSINISKVSWFTPYLSHRHLQEHAMIRQSSLTQKDNLFETVYLNIAR